MIDLHCHILPGVDDGPPTMEAALELGRAMTAAGVGRAVATSHVSEAYPNTAGNLADVRGRTQVALRDAGIDLELIPGAEIALEKLINLDHDEMRRLAIGSGSSVLVESPSIYAPSVFEVKLRTMLDQGFVPVLAHPERSGAFQTDPGRLRSLVGHGVLCCLTASAFEGRFGKTVKRFAVDILTEGLAHCVASDAHNLDRRPAGLIAGFAAVKREVPGARSAAAWFTEDAPGAVVSGESLPGPPPHLRRSRLHRALTRLSSHT